jgi:hypothetical protein
MAVTTKSRTSRSAGRPLRKNPQTSPAYPHATSETIIESSTFLSSWPMTRYAAFVGSCHLCRAARMFVAASRSRLRCNHRQDRGVG